MRQVAVIGSSSALPEDEIYQFAYNLGLELGKRNLVVVCGGRTGVMEAVCKGVKDSGKGITVGILTTYDGSDGNPYLDIKINTGLGWNRNPLVVASGEVVLAVGGHHFGTLSEIAYAKILNKTVIGYKTHRVEGVIQVSSLEEMLELLDSHLK
ncbi:MAG: TIGR00725 family protein [Aquificaceae bacterium]|nr:MAG: TIGR00725 family protein [Aquificaceae bacterium]